MSVIGQYIKKYRMAKGITQEQLGQLVGVSTQAVSKWECGGTPDVELLPAIASHLDVRIDALFGQQDRESTLALTKKIAQLPKEEAFQLAYSLCWAMSLGMMGEKEVPDEYIALVNSFSPGNGIQIPPWVRIMHDEGMAVARNAPDFQHFFLLLEPEGGLGSQLLEPEKLCAVFAVLADETLLKILYFLYTRLNTPIATSLISVHTGLTEQEADRYMEILCRHGFATRTAIAVSGGEIYAYQFRQESAVVPLLCFADELARNDERTVMWSFTRTKPLMASTDG